MIEVEARFIVPSDECDGQGNDHLRPFRDDGSLDESITERRRISPSFVRRRLAHDEEDDESRTPTAGRQVTVEFQGCGFACVPLQAYCLAHGLSRDVAEELAAGDAPTDERAADATERVRSVASAFWSSLEGSTLLRSRFGVAASGGGASANGAVVVLPTHVTFRAAPPDSMALVHIDYAPMLSLRDLVAEWWTRWKPYVEALAPSPEALAERFQLKGVVTLWISLQPGAGRMVENYPLLVADASSVGESDLVVYKVGKRHSVGDKYNPNTEWYQCEMGWGDAWAFDTRSVPHVAVKVDDANKDFIRYSAEVRSLILQKKLSADEA